MGTWWPKERFATSVMRGSSVQSLHVDAREGGQIVEIAADGQRQLWGTILIYQPFTYVKMDFHVPHPSEQKPGFSRVEVRFTELGSDRTSVELTQSNWEALGDVAKLVQGGYREAWVMIFDGAYRAACEQRHRTKPAPSERGGS